MDILILALIAGFILFRLYKVLGQDVGIKLSQQSSAADDVKTSGKKTAFKEKYNDDVQVQLAEVARIDPQFQQDEFLEGATKAFEMILEAVNKGDKDTLRALLAPKLFTQFDKLISAREKKGQTWDNTLVRVKSTNIDDVEIKDGSMVFITVKIVSDQILVTKDAKGKIIEGDPDQIEVLTDVVTFSRDATSDDPNWMLVKTTTND